MKGLEQLKIKSNMQFVYFDTKTLEGVRVDAYGREVGRHKANTDRSMKYFIQWLSHFQEYDNTEFVFIYDEANLSKIKFMKLK